MNVHIFHNILILIGTSQTESNTFSKKIVHLDFYCQAMDKLTPQQRSLLMSKVKSKNTKIELVVRRFLFAKGFRYRVNVKTLPGTPDIVLKNYRTVIFVNGCFWHGHDCSIYKTPTTRVEFWLNKIERNRDRDEKVRNQLRHLGWRTMVIWECQLKPKVRRQTLEEVATLLYGAYLDKYRKPKPKNYELPEKDVNIAAENKVEYGGNK